MRSKPLVVVPIQPPAAEQRVRRRARLAGPGEKKTRYSLPTGLESPTAVGYRTRVPLTRAEAEQAMALLSLARPSAFLEAASVNEATLFEEAALGVLSSRQSTNYRGFRQVTVDAQGSARIASILRRLDGLDAAALDSASHTHLVLTCRYKTPFTMLLTLAGHKPLLNVVTVPRRILEKRLGHADDIPTIGYLQHLHLGILADGMERAAVIASAGARAANVLLRPFTGGLRKPNAAAIKELEAIAGLTVAERANGWYLALVAQVGAPPDGERLDLDPALFRKVGANLMAFRSERIQPGVNQEESAPDPYQHRQDMDVPDELVVQAGRAAFNAFAHWSGCDRERAKDLLLLDRIDVLTPGGKERLRAIRRELNRTTDRLIKNLPLWADLPTGRAFSRNANRGRKAFSLAGQRIYVTGLNREAVASDGLDWNLAVRAVGAAAARSALYCELMGCVDLPPDCDLLAGVCLMAGPVNQNDIGKQFYGEEDLLAHTFPAGDPTSLLVWTLKAKTIADPIGNEEQLMNPSRKGALVDLRPGPHEVVSLLRGDRAVPMRSRDGRKNPERAFSDIGNFATSPDGDEIPGNRGEPWPHSWRDEPAL